jgi:hypothetical protein
MSRMNYQPAQPYAIPEALALRSEVTAAIWHPLHGDATQKLAQSAGGNLTVNGTVGTLWSANWGAATPDGAAHFLRGELSDLTHQELFDLRDLVGQELLIGFDLQTDGDVSQAECFFFYGANTGAGSRSGWALNLNSSEQIAIEIRANGGSSTATTAVAATAVQNASRHSYVLSLIATSVSEAQLRVLRWQHGTGPLDPRVSDVFTLVPNDAVNPPGVDSTIGLTLLARATTTSPDRFFGAAAGSNGQMNNFWAARLSQPVLGLAAACLEDMGIRSREFPRSLRQGA